MEPTSGNGQRNRLLQLWLVRIPHSGRPVLAALAAALPPVSQAGSLVLAHPGASVAGAVEAGDLGNDGT